MHLVHKVNVTLLKLNVTTFGGKVSQPLILKMKDLIMAFGFRDWEGEKSLSSYKRDPRVVCRKSKRKAFPRVRISLSYLQRERELQFFLKWERIPRRIFFLKRALIPRSWAVFKAFTFS